MTNNTDSRAFSIDFINNVLADLVTGAVIKGSPSSITDSLKRRRGAVTNWAYPMVGDILVYQYQERGQKIREFIQRQVESYKDEKVVLLAHSLGGVACFDLLIQEKLPQVELLITVGSQVPFFYEIDALQSLQYGKSLEDFPEWLNIFDMRDFLSYIGNKKGLFSGRVTDIPVDNKQPFPASHSAYWYNQKTWDVILEFLEKLS